MTIALIVLSIIGYIVAVGAWEPYFSRQLSLRCYNCAKGSTYALDGRTQEPGEGHVGFFLAAIWPFAYPYMLANYRQTPSLQLANARINAYWEDKKVSDRAERIRKLEAQNAQAQRELERVLEVDR